MGEREGDVVSLRGMGDAEGGVVDWALVQTLCDGDGGSREQASIFLLNVLSDGRPRLHCAMGLMQCRYLAAAHRRARGGVSVPRIAAEGIRADGADASLQCIARNVPRWWDSGAAFLGLIPDV